MASALYRQGKLCDCLVDALDGLISADKIPPELAMKVLDKFDEVFLASLRAAPPCSAALKGKVTTYQMTEGTWKFTTSELSIKPQLGSGEYFPETVIREPVSMQCLDTRLAVPEPE